MDRRRYLATLGAAAALGGCAGRPRDGGADGADGVSPTVTDGDTPTPASGDGVAVEPLATDLSVPWGAASRDGDLYLTERPGRIVRLADGAIEPVVEDVPVAAVGEGGLLGLAFHPEAPYAYTHQTYEPDGGGTANRLVRHDLDDDWAPEPLIEGIPGAHIHDGGRLLVHDDALYVTCGDAATGAHGQDRDVLAGSVLRVTPDGDPHPDNPFDSPVFSYGHRNPQGLTVRDGAVYSTEHGPSVGDEINVLRAGKNYGWPEVTGASDDGRFADPVTSYSPTIAPASAAVYDGPIEAWQGDFFFGTLAGEHLHRVRFDGDEAPGVAAEERLFDGEFGRVRTVFTGPDGHLHLTTSNRDGRGDPVAADDRVLRVVPA
ncbi:PQQ-dependent sugar dehydrogenase [Haloplanus pelagicus]|jgi:glucose/arabinose dehydrogenase|uniref:PQQ-dependent sugar dehydrogenase n=1 Tax=Haloplanus pelagicus TaxID=2949995 RepID=UPI00204137D7|nr:PQQ-dependent sugar dehydrogenase [Haloplanus sp. HW8-1]